MRSTSPIFIHSSIAQFAQGMSADDVPRSSITTCFCSPALLFVLNLNSIIKCLIFNHSTGNSHTRKDDDDDDDDYDGLTISL